MSRESRLVDVMRRDLGSREEPNSPERPLNVRAGPRAEPRKTAATSISESEYRMFQVKAADRGINVAEYLRRLIGAALREPS